MFGKRSPASRMPNVDKVSPILKSAHFPYTKGDITFQPTHKLVIVGNHLPEVRGTDRGIWRRMLPILFNQVIPDQTQAPNLLVKLKADTK